jgi:hypothetical protein
VHPGAGGRRLFEDIGKRRRIGLARLLTKLSDAELEGLLAGHRALRAARLAFAQESEKARVPDGATGRGRGR